MSPKSSLGSKVRSKRSSEFKFSHSSTPVSKIDSQISPRERIIVVLDDQMVNLEATKLLLLDFGF